MPEADGGRVADLEKAARRRFVRWNGRLWESLLSGPARRLAQSLSDTGFSPQTCEAVLDDYLRLAVEGIGLGYVVPEESGAQTVATLLWTRILPEGLAAVRAGKHAGILAACWNLAENLEGQPVWVRRVFLRALETSPQLDRLDRLVADVSLRLDEPPTQKLTKNFACRWIYLRKEDRAFLPGSVHFPAPTVACVHERREAGDSGHPASIGVWLEAEPLLLGPLGCRETPPKDPGLRLELLEALARQEPRADDWQAMATNEWRAAVTLETSQFLVALYPA